MNSFKNLSKEKISVVQLKSVKGGVSYSDWTNAEGPTVIGGGSRPTRPTSTLMIL